jgi:hypothetical protein
LRNSDVLHLDAVAGDVGLTAPEAGPRDDIGGDFSGGSVATVLSGR